MRIATLTAGIILSMAFAGTASATSYMNFDWEKHDLNYDDWKEGPDRHDNDRGVGHYSHGQGLGLGHYRDKPKHDGGIVPEPSAALLFGLGSLVTTGAIRRRR